MFRNLTAVAAALFVLAFSVPSANASVITFDDHAGTYHGVPIEDGYKGFDWGNFNALDTVNYDRNPSGYQAGTVSLDNVAYNRFGHDATISSSNLFNLNSAYFTGAWNDALNISVKGYLDGVEQYSKTFDVSSSIATLVTFNWANINSVLFSSSGGVDDPHYAGTGYHFAMDNLDISSVPVPAALPLFGLGLAGVSGLGFKRKRKEKTA